VENAIDAAAAIYRAASANLGRVAVKGHKIRLIGVSVSGLWRCPK